jgi:rhombotail lipoprotein
VQFLYPDKDAPFITPTTPTLRLPLRVGIAFVPGHEGSRTGYLRSSDLSEMRKRELLRGVAAQFRSLPFVSSIEVVPTSYLRANGGFTNLDQIRALLGIDVIALVAYDQTQVTTETPWSLAYWTLVGAYVVQAQKNDTHTLIEAVVYDIESRSLLFHAPGANLKKAHSTLITTEDYLRQASAESYSDAAADLTLNLQREIEVFKTRAKEQPESVRIEHRPGYTGAGSLGLAGAAAMLLLGMGLAAERFRP